jgi:Rnl2 family RNA ligase
MSQLVFEAYPSVDTVNSQKKIDKLLAPLQIAGVDLKWVASEKVHGVNFMVKTNGQETRFGRRSAFLEMDARFNSFQTLVPEMTEKVLKLREIMQKDVITVYGELFGGCYKHDLVPPVHFVPKIQREVQYAPSIHFAAFDIRYDDTHWVPYNQSLDLLKQAGFMCLEPLAIGTLQEIFDIDPNALTTTIPSVLGLPEIPDNIVEGIVIRPYDSSEYRFLFKKKSKAFVEKKDKPVSRPPPQSSEEIDLYFTVARIKNVLSKEENVSTREECYKHMDKVVDDALKDYKKETGLGDESVPSMFRKFGIRAVSKLIRENEADILNV